MNVARAREIVAASDPWLDLGRPGTNVHVMIGSEDDDDVASLPVLDAFVADLASIIDEIDAASTVTSREPTVEGLQMMYHGPSGTAYASHHGTGAAPDGGRLVDVSFGVMHPRSSLHPHVRSMHLAERPTETGTYRRLAVALLDLTLGAIDGDLEDVPGDVADASLEACHSLRDVLASRRGTDVARTFCSFALLGSVAFVQGMKAGTPVGIGAPVTGLPEAASLWIKRERNLWVAELRPFTTSSLLTEEPDPVRRLRRLGTVEKTGIRIGEPYRRRRAA